MLYLLAAACAHKNPLDLKCFMFRFNRRQRESAVESLVILTSDSLVDRSCCTKSLVELIQDRLGCHKVHHTLRGSCSVSLWPMLYGTILQKRGPTRLILAYAQVH